MLTLTICLDEAQPIKIVTTALKAIAEYIRQALSRYPLENKVNAPPRVNPAIAT